jgi:hypothetical protein
MSTPSDKAGDIEQSERPDWYPLLELVGEEVTADFMWMYEVRLKPRGRLQAYKHIDTRRYLHLDRQGKAYDFRGPNRYRRVPAIDALVSAFASLPQLCCRTPEQLERSWAAVERLSEAYIPPPWPATLSEE